MKKILVAEDDRFLSNAYRIKLTKAGYEVKTAKDGKDALELVTSFSPDLILLDLVMPVMDGFSFLEEIKKQPDYKNIPIIVASNLGQKEDTSKALELGAKDFVVKSDLSLELLVSKIRSIIGT